MEPEPEKNSDPFKHPQGLDPDQPQASSSNSIDSIEDVDSTSSFSIPATRRRNRKNSKQKPKKGNKNVSSASNLSEDEQLEEAMRISLEQSRLEEAIKRKEKAEIDKAINESMCINNEESHFGDISSSSIASTDGMSSSNITYRDKKYKKPGKKAIYNEVINMRDSDCDTSTICNGRPENKSTIQASEEIESFVEQSEDEISSTKDKTSIPQKHSHFENGASKIGYDFDSSDYESCEDTTQDEASTTHISRNSTVEVEDNDSKEKGAKDQHTMYKEFKIAENQIRKCLITRIFGGTIFFHTYNPIFAQY